MSRAVLEDADEEEGGEGSWRPLLMTVFSVVKLDASVAVMRLTFGTLGVIGMGLFLIDELSKRLFLVVSGFIDIPKLRVRLICIRIGSGRLSSSNTGVDSPVFLLRVGVRKSCGVRGRSGGSGECWVVSEDVTEVVKSSRSRARFSTPLDRFLRFFGLVDEEFVVG